MSSTVEMTLTNAADSSRSSLRTRRSSAPSSELRLTNTTTNEASSNALINTCALSHFHGYPTYPRRGRAGVVLPLAQKTTQTDRHFSGLVCLAFFAHSQRRSAAGTRCRECIIHVRW